ncbi:MAG: L-threonine 3-dehydrogenase [Proteobacteria bacterium]|nr:L-threonine 3-dehydrogenase [Pseudomonadota bacterium]
MKCLMKLKPGEGIWMSEQPVPEIGDDQVLIRIKKTAICGTDIHIYNWDDWAAKTVPIPMITGHEYSGQIAEVGKHATHLKVGQYVTGEGHVIGQFSRNARAGRFHLSPDTRGIGVDLPGAFAEYLALPAFNVIQLPGNIPGDIAAIMDPLGNATHATLSFDLVGEDVLITGAGPIGIMAAAIARHVGARHIVITDVNQYRLDLASKVADVVPVHASKEDLKDVQNKLGMTEGFDVGLEMSGSPEALSQMINNMIMGGKIALLGLPSGPVEVDIPAVIMKALRIKAIYGREMYETWYKMVAMLESGLDVSKIITHRFDIDDFQKGFDAMRSGQSGKVILNWE